MAEVFYRDEKGRYLSKITPKITQYTGYYDDAESDFTITWTDHQKASFGYAPYFRHDLDLLLRLGYRMHISNTPDDNPQGLHEEEIRRLPPKSVSRMNLPSFEVAIMTTNGVKTLTGDILAYGEILALGDMNAISNLCRRARDNNYVVDYTYLTKEEADTLLAWRTGLSIVFLPLAGPSEPTLLASYHNVDWLRDVLASTIENDKHKSRDTA